MARRTNGAAEPEAAEPRAMMVYRALRRAVIEGALAPGLKLPEDAIGENLGVSRTLVREAFMRLAAEGLVDLKPNRGAFVAHPSLEEGRHIFAVRGSLERLVVATLAGALTRAQVAALEAHVEAERRAQGHDEPESIRLAGEFHMLLAEMTGNALLARYVGEVSSRCSLILALYGRPHSSECAVSEHSEIIAALVAGDAAGAERIMSGHLEAVMGRALLAPRRPQDIGTVLAAYGEAVGLNRARERA